MPMRAAKTRPNWVLSLKPHTNAISVMERCAGRASASSFAARSTRFPPDMGHQSLVAFRKNPLQQTGGNSQGLRVKSLLQAGRSNGSISVSRSAHGKAATQCWFLPHKQSLLLVPMRSPTPRPRQSKAGMVRHPLPIGSCKAVAAATVIVAIPIRATRCQDRATLGQQRTVNSLRAVRTMERRNRRGRAGLV
jgi:hypothetical protein